MRENKIVKIKYKVLDTGEEKVLIMGNSYKSFELHFQDIISGFTKKWVYDDSPQGNGRCLGRTLTIDILEMYEANEKFVSFGGLKSCGEKFYDAEVEEHNKNTEGDACKRLSEINFVPMNPKVMQLLLSHNRIIKG